MPQLFTLETFGTVAYAPGQAEGSWYGLIGIIRHGGENTYKVDYLDRESVRWISIKDNTIGPISGEPDRSSEGVYAYIYDRLT